MFYDLLPILQNPAKEEALRHLKDILESKRRQMRSIELTTALSKQLASAITPDQQERLKRLRMDTLPSAKRNLEGLHLLRALLQTQDTFSTANVDTVLRLKTENHPFAEVMLPVLEKYASEQQVAIAGFPVEEDLELPKSESQKAINLLTVHYNTSRLRLAGLKLSTGWVYRPFFQLRTKLKGMFASNSKLHRIDKPQWMFDHLFKLIRLNADKLCQLGVPPELRQQAVLYVQEALRDVIVQRTAQNLSAFQQDGLALFKYFLTFGQFQRSISQLVNCSRTTAFESVLRQFQQLCDLLLQAEVKHAMEKVGDSWTYQPQKIEDTKQRLRKLLIIIQSCLRKYRLINERQPFVDSFSNHYGKALEGVVGGLFRSFKAITAEKHLEIAEFGLLVQHFKQLSALLSALIEELGSFCPSVVRQSQNQLDTWQGKIKDLLSSIGKSLASEICKEIRKLVYTRGELVIKQCEFIQYEEEFKAMAKRYEKKAVFVVEELGPALVTGFEQLLFEFVEKNLEMGSKGLNLLVQEMVNMCCRLSYSKEVSRLAEAKKWILADRGEVQKQLAKQDCCLSQRQAQLLLRFSGLQIDK